MSGLVVRIGGIVRPEREPEQELPQIATVLGEEEFAEWMAEYNAGRWVLVCVEMFADVLSENGVTRYHDGGVHSLYFGVPHGEDNLAHAREAVAEYVDNLAAALNDHDIDVTPERLGRLPIAIELAPEIETQITV